MQKTKKTIKTTEKNQNNQEHTLADPLKQVLESKLMAAENCVNKQISLYSKTIWGGGAPLKPGLRNQQIIHFQNLKSRTSSGIRRMSFSYIGEIVKKDGGS